MNTKTKNQLKRLLQEELIKRLLVKYFKEKGFDESFNQMVYPPLIFDMPFRILELMSCVEVVPYVDKMDPITNAVTMGWNLFVLGTNRVYLGTTTHPNLMEFRRSLMGQHNTKYPADSKKTPKEIIEFIMAIIGRNKDAIMEIPPGARLPQMSQYMPMGVNRPRIGPTAAGSFYEKNRPV